jgi:hypothetical protein
MVSLVRGKLPMGEIIRPGMKGWVSQWRGMYGWMNVWIKGMINIWMNN